MMHDLSKSTIDNNNVVIFTHFNKPMAMVVYLFIIRISRVHDAICLKDTFLIHVSLKVGV